MKQFKKIFAFVMALAMILSTVSLLTLESAAEESASTAVIGDAELSIDYCNLDFKTNVKIVYAVQAKNITNRNNIQLLLWEELPAEYTKGTEDYALAPEGVTTYSNEEYVVYEFSELGAMNMVDYFYAVAYYAVDDTVIYSEPLKFSVLEYAYAILGKNGDEPYADASFRDAMEAMLNYGAAMQVYNNYRTDALANGEFSYIKT